MAEEAKRPQDCERTVPEAQEQRETVISRVRQRIASSLADPRPRVPLEEAFERLTRRGPRWQVDDGRDKCGHVRTWWNR